MTSESRAETLIERLEWRIKKWMNRKVGERTPFIDQDAVLLNDCLIVLRGGVTLEPPTSYVQEVPDHCDRIIWRGSYLHLPLRPVVPTPKWTCQSCGHAVAEPTKGTAGLCDQCVEGGIPRASILAEPPPIPMVIRCPHCGTQHVDKAEPENGWDNPPHTSHLCHGCGAIWRDASVPTNGVESVPPGKHDRPPTAPAAAPAQDGALLSNERAWLETVAVGEELALHGPKGAGAFLVGFNDLERFGYVRVQRDGYGLKITRLK